MFGRDTGTPAGAASLRPIHGRLSREADREPGAPSLSSVLKEVVRDLCFAHPELVPVTHRAVRERDELLQAVDAAVSIGALEAAVARREVRLRETLVWLRHVAQAVRWLEAAKADQRAALDRLARLRDLSGEDGLPAWLMPQPRDAQPAASNAARRSRTVRRISVTDRLRLTGMAVERGPDALDGWLRRYRTNRLLRRAWSVVARLIFLASAAAVVLFWGRLGWPGPAWAAAGGAVWLLFEAGVAPRLRRRRLERARLRLRRAVEDFTSSQLIALLELGLLERAGEAPR